MVAEAAHGKIAGYTLAWLLADELQLLSVAVHPHHQRQGIGKRLLEELLATWCASSYGTCQMLLVP